MESEHRDRWREMSWKIFSSGPGSISRQKGQQQHPTLCRAEPCHKLGRAELGFLHAELSRAKPAHPQLHQAELSWAQPNCARPCLVMPCQAQTSQTLPLGMTPDQALPGCAQRCPARLGQATLG